MYGRLQPVDGQVQVKPGDTVSLIVRGRNPLEPQKFVDVGSLLMELQKSPAAADGSYHVFLAPPDFPLPSGGQKFDVTYVGAPQREPAKDPRNPHPPLFVAPLNYSVPQGYGRVQIPTRNVKFALTNQFVAAPLQQQQQPSPFQSFRQAQAIQFNQQTKPVNQFQQPINAPSANQLKQSGQLSTPQSVGVNLQQQPQFQPVQNIRFQPQPQPQAIVQRPPVKFQPSAPSVFDQQDVRIQTGFVPLQSLEEPTPPPAPVSAPKEPLVLAVESPDFLKISQPLPPPPPPSGVLVDIPAPKLTVTEAPLPTTTPVQSVVVEKVTDKIIRPNKEVPAPITLIPLPEDFTTPAPTPAFEETIQAASPIPAPEVSSLPPIAAPEKKRPSIRVPVQGGAPQWPDFQSVRQRQQLQRQQNNNRKKTTASSTSTGSFNGNSFRQTSPDSFSSDVPIEFSFGQKIKVKTNALVSPPLPVEAKATVQQLESLDDIDPPVLERDEAFQTLESQNSANSGGNQRGRIRFNRPIDVNAIPADASTAPPPPARQTVSTLVGGRNRFRIATSTAAPPVTEEPVTEEPAEVEVRGDSPIESGSEAEQDGEEGLSVVEENKADEPLEEKPWSPYEAIQRQRESTLTEPEAESQIFSNSGQPIRNRGKTTFTSSRIPLPPVVRPDVTANRQIVLRPAASIVRRPSNPPSSIRLTKPILEDEKNSPRLQEDLIPPSAPGFGIRDGGAPENPSAAGQFLVPIGRRVPELRRPGLQVIPIGRSTTAKTPVAVEEDPVLLEEDPIAVEEAAAVEEDPAAGDLPSETEEFVTDEPALFDQGAVAEGGEEVEGADEDVLGVEGEEEILTEEVEGEVVEEELDQTINADLNSQQDVDQQIDGVVNEEPSALDASVPTTTAATVASSVESSVGNSFEVSAGNSVDDAAKQSEVLGVSTATEVSLMYELCYRGRCVRVHE